MFFSLFPHENIFCGRGYTMSTSDIFDIYILFGWKNCILEMLIYVSTTADNTLKDFFFFRENTASHFMQNHQILLGRLFT